MVEDNKKSLNVLLVDDHAYNCLMMEMILNRIGCSCESASNGIIALDKLSFGRFDLVLMDCMMPEMSGVKLVRIIRQAKTEYAGIPIICTSSMHNSHPYL